MKKVILILFFMMISTQTVNALCWNPLELFCIFVEDYVTPEDTNKIQFADNGLNLSLYYVSGEEKVYIPYKDKLGQKEKSGFILNETDIKQYLSDRTISFNNIIKIEVQSDNTLSQSNDNYLVFYHDLSNTSIVTDQIGKKITTNLKRFIDFSSIPLKEENYKIASTVKKTVEFCNPISEKNGKITCNTELREIEVTTFTKRNYSITSEAKDKNIILSFDNLYDLDPVLVDDTDTQWNGGSYRAMIALGTGNDANLTSQGLNGSYSSRIFDSENINSNWTNFSIGLESPYGEEMNKNGFGFNTTGLWAYYKFNNNSLDNENDGVIKDYSGMQNDLAGSSLNSDLLSVFGKSVKCSGASNMYVNDTSKSWNSNNITISFWNYFRSADSATAAGNLNIGGVDTGAGNRAGFHAPYSDGNIYWDYGDITGSGRVSTSYTGYYDRWVHVVGISTGPNNYMELWLDGALATNRSGSSTPVGSNKVQVCSYGFAYSVGNMDEVMIFNRSLQKDEVKQLYLMGANKFNVSGQICSDSSCATILERKNISINSSFGRKANLNFSQKGRYFQYNITYSVNSTNPSTIYKMVVNNISIEYSFETTSINISNYSNVNFIPFNYSYTRITYNPLNETYLNFNGSLLNFINVSKMESNLLNLSSDLTVSCWVKSINNSGTGRHIIMSKMRGANVDLEWTLASSTTGTPSFTVFNQSGNNWAIGLGSTVMNSNTWYMVTATLNHSGKKVKVYLNGLVDANATGTTSQRANGKSDILIGRRVTMGADKPWNGSIDDCKIYNKTLKDSQIRRMYNESIYGGNLLRSIPVLSYHQIESLANDVAIVNYTQFEMQMDYLNRSGFNTITYSRWLEWKSNNNTLPDKSIILVFDDARENVFTNATPIMDRYGFIGVLGVISGRSGISLTNESGNQNTYMNWSLILNLSRKGWEIAAHSINHTNMTNLEQNDLIEQFNITYRNILTNISIRPSVWIYPYNKHNQSTDDTCARFYSICSGTSLAITDKDYYLYKNINLTHGDIYAVEDYTNKVNGVRRLIISNITNINLFQEEVDYHSNLIASWKFDEGNGTIAYDISGNNIHGEIWNNTWNFTGSNINKIRVRSNDYFFIINVSNKTNNYVWDNGTMIQPTITNELNLPFFFESTIREGCTCPANEDWIINGNLNCSLNTECIIENHDIIINYGSIRLFDNGLIKANDCKGRMGFAKIFGSIGTKLFCKS